MARREREDQERTSRERTDNAQTFVAQFLAQHIQRLRKLSELQITRDLVGENSWLHKIAREFATARREEDKLKPTQLRRVFHDLKRLEKQRFNEAMVAMIMPQLAYAYGRNVIPRPFYEFMRGLLSKVQDKEDLERLSQLLTTLLAYHKFHERRREGSEQGAGTREPQGGEEQ